MPPAVPRAWLWALAWGLAGASAWGEGLRAPRAEAPPPRLEARAWVLVDAAGGWRLAEKAPDRPLPPASLAKLMTAYLAFRRLADEPGSAGRMVDIPAAAVAAGGARLYLRAGERVGMEDLLAGMLVASANDAARALAVHLGGGLEAFTAAMNRTAAELGMQATRYTGPAGFAPGARTTARDTARLCRALLAEFPARYALFGRRRFEFQGLTFYNRNDLLWAGAGVDGLKTGQLRSAGFHLAASARRGGRRLIAVVLGAPDAAARRRGALALLDYGFAHYRSHRLYRAGEAVVRVPVEGGSRRQVAAVPARPVDVTLPRGGLKMLAIHFKARSRLAAPVAAGAPLGRLTLLYRDTPLLEVPLVAGGAVPRGNLLHRLWHRLQAWLGPDGEAAPAARSK